MLLVGIACTGGVSLTWGSFFLWHGSWTVGAMDVGILILAGIDALLLHQGRVRAASRMLLAVMYAVLVFNATVFDIPTAAVPRSVHQFILALGVAASLLMRDEPRWLKFGAPMLCFVTYVVLASTNAGWVTSLALPDSVRKTGTWLNCAVALAVLFGALQIIQSDIADRNVMVGELREALLRGELLLHYQPQVDSDNRITGAEALARWPHPTRGMVSPAEFIPLAEQCGLMIPLGEWVLRTACAQLVRWSQRPATEGLTLAVNVSALQFSQPDFAARVRQIVDESGANPRRLKLELTESVLATNLADIVAKMTLLKSLGITFALDDFGTGFSSLTYLRRLPLDQLKIDQSFVRDMLASVHGAGIAQAIVALGKTLGLAVIAEGVETADQRALLFDIGCTHYQGYLFSKPLTSAAFSSFVAKFEPSAGIESRCQEATLAREGPA